MAKADNHKYGPTVLTTIGRRSNEVNFSTCIRMEVGAILDSKNEAADR